MKPTLKRLIRKVDQEPDTSEWRKETFSGLSTNTALTLRGFLSMWTMTTLLDVETTLNYLAYLGYHEYQPSSPTTPSLKTTNTVPSPSSVINYERLDPKEAILVTKNSIRKQKKLDSLNNRLTVRALVVGAAGCGKTEFLKGLVEGTYTTEHTRPNSFFSVVNTVEVRGFEKYLIIEEESAHDVLSIFDDPKKADAYHVFCFLYDRSDPSSFSYILELRVMID